MDTGTEVRLGPGDARVMFSVRWFGLFTVRGWFADIRGRLRPSTAEGGPVAVDVKVSSASVCTGLALRDRHLRGSQFLDAARHEMISFRGESRTGMDGTAAVSGVLTVCGDERAIEATCWVSEKDLDRGAPNAVAVVQFSLPRLDHGVGTASGIGRLNPLLWAIGTSVSIRVEILVPVTMIRSEPGLAQSRRPARPPQSTLRAPRG